MRRRIKKAVRVTLISFFPGILTVTMVTVQTDSFYDNYQVYDQAIRTSKIGLEGRMKNWLLPVIVLGVSGVGLACASDRGRRKVHSFFERVSHAQDPLAEFNKALDQQLANIQQTLDQLSEALEN
jgi:hypothetical protein